MIGRVFMPQICDKTPVVSHKSHSSMLGYAVPALVIQPAVQVAAPPPDPAPEPGAGPWKRKFSPAEDDLIRYLVTVFGLDHWKNIAACLQGRSVRQCRERWKYYLEPRINHSDWTAEEDNLLVEKEGQLGPKWAQICTFFPGRTDVDVKNRFHRIRRSNEKAARKSGRRSRIHPADDIAEESAPSQRPAPFPPIALPPLPQFALPPLPAPFNPPRQADVPPPRPATHTVKRTICKPVAAPSA
jgi:hypothetical protein